MIRSATRKILDGTALKIEEPLPDFLIDEGVTEWYMAQPDPELYDDGQMVYQAKRLWALENPDIKALSAMEPTTQWQEAQQEAITSLQTQIDELIAKRNAAVEQWRDEHEEDDEPPKTIGLTPDEAHDLSTLLSWKEGVELQSKFANRATEIVDQRAAEARANYVMPWLIMDKDGNPLFDLETDEGRSRWHRISLYKRTALRGCFNATLHLVRTAKN